MDTAGIAISHILGGLFLCGGEVSRWRHQPRKLPPAALLPPQTLLHTSHPILLLLPTACSACLKLDFLFLLFLPPFILFFLIILFISVPPAPPDLLPYFSPPPRP